jgi:hypothetical protein
MCYKILESLQSDITEQMDAMLEKYSVILSECGIKTQHELNAMLQGNYPSDLVLFIPFRRFLERFGVASGI